MTHRCSLYIFFLIQWVASINCASAYPPREIPNWSVRDLKILKTLWIGSLPPPPIDPTNRVASDPCAAALGKAIFFDSRISANGKVSCASCHRPENLFTDRLRLGQGVGVSKRHTPTIVGAAYSPWQFWDGRRDTLWAQALAPIESRVEHGLSRVDAVSRILGFYGEIYRKIFGEIPDVSDRERFPEAARPTGDRSEIELWESMLESDRGIVDRVFSNIGKALAAYERTLIWSPSRFDRYLEKIFQGDHHEASAFLSSEDVEGLRLFIGKARCLDCQNGPLFTNSDFHSTVVPRGESEDFGRAEGFSELLDDPFNCMGVFSDTPRESCSEIRFLRTGFEEYYSAFKVPTLRGVNQTAPYMHAGQFLTLLEVLEHYNIAPKASPPGHSDIVPLSLASEEIQQLIGFLRALDSEVVEWNSDRVCEMLTWSEKIGPPG